MSHSVMTVLSNTFWVTYVTGYYERWKTVILALKLGIKSALFYFPVGRTDQSISPWYSLQEAKSHYHSRCIFLYSRREEISLNSDCF